MVVAPIAFLRHRRIKPKNRKHEWLAEPLRQPLPDQTRGPVQARLQILHAAMGSYHYSGFTNFWYTFEYRCQSTRPALDMGLTKGRLEVEQVE
jgi:hypothetical protein